MASDSVDSMLLMCTKPENGEELQQEKKPRPADEQALKCPRCDSANTKFCYYNNYSLTQPRYFCKSCRRYWTKGGTLRNVPVGGGCRKNKRSSSLNKRSTPDSHIDQVHDFIRPLCSTYDQNLALNHGNTHLDLFGNPIGNSFLDSLRSGLIDNNHLMYYGLEGSGNFGNGENGVDSNYEDRGKLGMQYHDDHYTNLEIMSNGSSGSSTPTVKQELGENVMLWGFPWQLNGEVNYTNGENNEIDLLKEGWNSAIVGSSWNNLLNSPLM